MITIARLQTRAWKCYREPLDLRLEAKAYALFAREAGNDARSNFLGKSSLAEAVDFALYGRLAAEFRHKKRGWVSRGEKSGEVALELSDGSRVVRSQQLSGSERLWYFPPGSPEKGATQERAQQKIDELVGLSREDFTSTRYFQQGEMSRLVKLDPGPRLDLVCGWLRLGPVQECADDAQEALRELARRRDAAAAQARAAEEAERAAYARVGAAGAEDPALQVARAIDQGEGAEQDAHAAVRDAEALVDRGREHADLRAAAEAYERVVAEGKRVAGEIAAMRTVIQIPKDSPEESERKVDSVEVMVIRADLELVLREANEALRAAAAESGAAQVDESGKRRVATGRFDGGCPLVGAPCPARAWVEGEAATARAAADGARAGLERAAEAHGEASRAQAEAASRLHALDSKARRLGELRREAARLLPAYRRWESGSRDPAPGDPAAALEEARAELRSVEGILRDLRAAQDAVAEARARREEHLEEARRLDVAVRTAAAAAAIFGKAGAQRRLAEDPLSEIEGRACAMLSRVGSPLRVRVAWSREGSGVAAACGACGEPFPRSEKVKACARCGADRGPNVVHRLEIEPSAQSGGARDLAGIFVQLAAAAWLVEDRESRWGTALLDEPLAALDAHHRRAIAAHLPALLRESGVGQAFVIGHDRAALDALPGRILVESRDGWSTARVEA